MSHKLVKYICSCVTILCYCLQGMINTYNKFIICKKLRYGKALFVCHTDFCEIYL